MDYGNSRVVDSKVNIIADTGNQEGIAIAETDMLIDANSVGVDDSGDFSIFWGMMKKNAIVMDLKVPNYANRVMQLIG